MLGVLDLEVNRYLEWVKKGPSEFSEKSVYPIATIPRPETDQKESAEL